MNTRTWIIWLLAALLIVGLTSNPLYLLLALLAATLVFLACRANDSLATAYRLFFLGGLALWLGYIIFSLVTVGGARGRTELVQLPTYTLPALLGGITLGGPITAEDLAWGALRGLRLWALLACFGTFNALIEHYRLLRLAPRSFFHAGLVVTIAISFVPQTLRAIGEISDAQRIRGHRLRGLRSYLPLVAPLLAGSLEKSIQLAEALDARGYGRTRAADRRHGQLQLLLIAGVLLLGAGLFGWLYYGAAAELPALGLGGLGALLLGLALAGLGRLVPRTTYRRERWRPRDTLVAGTAGLAAAGWVALWLGSAASLAYNPYPILALPAFEPLAGVCVALLAVPALVGPAPAREQRRRPSTVRAPRTREEAPARTALPLPSPLAWGERQGVRGTPELD